MRILILRHGEPDYALDCLTERGWKQAEALAERLSHERIHSFYVSPMGRAEQTWLATSRKFPDMTAAVCDWLHEFDLLWENPRSGKREAVWDIAPDDWTAFPELYDRDNWYRHPAMEKAGMGERIRGVDAGVDALLKDFGLVREANHYRAVHPSDETIALFCHYGAMCAVTAHLLNISPMVLWQGANADFTAVTELCTDDRYEDVTNFRINLWNDTRHLHTHGHDRLGT